MTSIKNLEGELQRLQSRQADIQERSSELERLVAQNESDHRALLAARELGELPDDRDLKRAQKDLTESRDRVAALSAAAEVLGSRIADTQKRLHEERESMALGELTAAIGELAQAVDLLIGHEKEAAALLPRLAEWCAQVVTRGRAYSDLSGHRAGRLPDFHEQLRSVIPQHPSLGSVWGSAAIALTCLSELGINWATQPQARKGPGGKVPVLEAK